MFRRPRETKHFQILKERVRQPRETDKPLYKMKMFSGAESKVAAHVQNFKTFNGKFFKNTSNLDNLISKVEEDIRGLN
jgi:hypothetical protein